MTSPLRTTRRGTVAMLGVTAALLAMPAAPAAAGEPVPPDIEATTPDIRLAEAQELVSELRMRVDELSAENDVLADRNTTLLDENGALADERDHLLEEVDTLTRDRDRIADGLSRFEDLYDPLEADRQLLLDLRKPIEDMSRPEVEQHVARIQRLAVESNPAELGPLSDRLGEAAPDFLDWRETQFSSTEEATQAFLDSGASLFTSSMDDFSKAFLLSVASRLDGLLTVLDGAR
jgi:hypothetical protein